MIRRLFEIKTVQLWSAAETANAIYFFVFNAPEALKERLPGVERRLVTLRPG
jgi:hypothetical protein